MVPKTGSGSILVRIWLDSGSILGCPKWVLKALHRLPLAFPGCHDTLDLETLLLCHVGRPASLGTWFDLVYLSGGFHLCRDMLDLEYLRDATYLIGNASASSCVTTWSICLVDPIGATTYLIWINVSSVCPILVCPSGLSIVKFLSK